jgi:hypothetical protein
MAESTSSSRINIYINNDEAKRKLVELDEAYRKNSDELQKVADKSHQLAGAYADLDKVQAALANKIAACTAKVSESAGGNEKAKRALAALNSEYGANAVKLQSLREQLTEASRSASGFKDAQSKLKAEMGAQSKAAGLNALSFNQLSAEYRRLSAMQKAAIPNSPAWVQLGKDLSVVKGRMEEVQSSGKKIDGVLGSLSGAVKANLLSFTAWGAAKKVLEGVKTVVADMVSGTQVLGDKWAQVMGGMKSGYEAFVKSLASGEWGSLVGNVRMAISAGAEFAAAMDDLGDKERSYRMRAAEARVALSELTNQLKNVNLSRKERIAIADQIIKKEGELAAEEQRNAEASYRAELKRVAVTAGFKEQEIGQLEAYLYQYTAADAAEAKIMEGKRKRAQEYQKAVDGAMKERVSVPRSESKGGALVGPNLKKVIALQKEYGEETVKLAEVQAKYGKTSDEDLSKLVEKYVALQAVSQKYNEGVSAAAARREKLIKGEGDSQKADDKKAQQEADDQQKQDDERLKQRAAYFAALQKLADEAAAKQGTAQDQELLAVNQRYDAEIDRAREALAGQLISEEEYSAAVRQVEALRSAALAEVHDKARAEEAKQREAFDKAQQEARKKYGMMGLQELEAEELALLRKAYDDKLLLSGEYERAKAAVEEKYRKQKQDADVKEVADFVKAAQEKLGAASAAVSAASGLTKSLQEAELAEGAARQEQALAALTEQYNAQLITQEDYEAQKAQLDYAAKREALETEKKYADANFALKLLEIGASTATGIAGAWASSMALSFVKC